MAEGGNTGPLEAQLSAMKVVGDTASSGGLLDPGDSVTLIVAGGGRFDHISLVSMLIPTNDAFFALNGVKAPKGRNTTRLVSPAYDAGTEPNDESCDNIPGPVCGGEGTDLDEDGEGFIHIHAGIHGIGSLDESERDWRNPVAAVSIRRIGGGTTTRSSSER